MKSTRLCPSFGGQGASQDWWCSALFPGQPSCPFGSIRYPQLLSNKHTHPAAAGTTQPGLACPHIPKLKESGFQPLLLCLPPPPPPQGRQTHRSLHCGIFSSPSHTYLTESQEDSPNPLKPPTCTPNPNWHPQPAASPWVPIHYYTEYHPHCEWNLITTQAKQLAEPPASRETKWRQKEGQPWGRF